jgi:hypothetical protein
VACWAGFLKTLPLRSVSCFILSICELILKFSFLCSTEDDAGPVLYQEPVLMLYSMLYFFKSRVGSRLPTYRTATRYYDRYFSGQQQQSTINNNNQYKTSTINTKHQQLIISTSTHQRINKHRQSTTTTAAATGIPHLHTTLACSF